ncbi:hypothetical protein SNEBB_008937 [Seison nebaliae]|nr:hypothetical protein SNEBB_008937 [Seison nebaliae]
MSNRFLRRNYSTNNDDGEEDEDDEGEEEGNRNNDKWKDGHVRHRYVRYKDFHLQLGNEISNESLTDSSTTSLSEFHGSMTKSHSESEWKNSLIKNHDEILFKKIDNLLPSTDIDIHRLNVSSSTSSLSSVASTVTSTVAPAMLLPTSTIENEKRKKNRFASQKFPSEYFKNDLLENDSRKILLPASTITGNESLNDSSTNKNHRRPNNHFIYRKSDDDQENKRNWKIKRNDENNIRTFLSKDMNGNQLSDSHNTSIDRYKQHHQQLHKRTFYHRSPSSQTVSSTGGGRVGTERMMNGKKIPSHFKQKNDVDDFTDIRYAYDTDVSFKTVISPPSPAPSSLSGPLHKKFPSTTSLSNILTKIKPKKYIVNQNDSTMNLSENQLNIDRTLHHSKSSDRPLHVERRYSDVRFMRNLSLRRCGSFNYNSFTSQPLAYMKEFDVTKSLMVRCFYLNFLFFLKHF